MAYEGISHVNPPRPPGVRPWTGRVPADATAWAKEVINSPGLYPMHSESVRVVGDKFAMIRVEWHTWSTKGQHGQGGDPNEKIAGTFRGATLYQVTDPEAFGQHYYDSNQDNFTVSGGTMSRQSRRQYYGAAPAAPRPTVTGQAAGLLNLAARPVKWTFHTAGSLVNWVGDTLKTVGNKL